MANKDLKLISTLIEKSKSISNIEFQCDDSEQLEKYEACKKKVSHPLDGDVIKEIEKIAIRDDIDDEFQIYKYSKEINVIWKLIIEKSIKCLRFFDKREPFLTNSSKSPIAYGVTELGEYFDKYTEFESLLYGGGKYYRDHVVHVFRTWLLGIECLLENNAKYLEKINIGENVVVNPLEKISIWSIISLTHDLGYPLEKSQEIIDKTKDMMKSFIVNPIVSMDLSFNGVQNNMNDFVVRFLSSKMHKKELTLHSDESNSDSKETETKYVARLQPKYYFKFQKSLEKSKHGILSAIIIYKLLLYFLESDYSINEDYVFDEEDVRQFYIRREILRAISSHTCHDIYHLDMLNFAFLLIIVDDSQEWGRKRIGELYVKTKTKYEFNEIKPSFDIGVLEIEKNGKNKTIKIHKCTASEQFSLPSEDTSGLTRLLFSLIEQSESYKEIFRDGQDTSSRNFTFIKKSKINCEDAKTVVFDIEFIISNGDNSMFTVDVSLTGNEEVNNKYDIKFLRKVYTNCTVKEIDKNDDKIKYEISVKSSLHGNRSL